MAEVHEHKGLQLKLQDEAGAVRAVFATLNVVDKDGDITVPGAFESGAEVIISAYGHQSWGGSLPVGKGVINEVGNEAVFEGRFFLNTTHGRDTYETLKGLGERQEWSYGYNVLDSEQQTIDGKSVRVLKKLKVVEVSPVLVGAGVNTRTLAVKGATGPITEVEWKGAQTLLERVIQMHQMHLDDPTTATIESQQEMMGLLQRTRAELQLAADAMKTAKGGGMSFVDHADATLADVSAFIERTKSLADLRAKEGRVLSSANRQRLEALMESMRAAMTDLEALLAETSKNADRDERIKAQALLLEFESIKSRTMRLMRN